MTPLDRLRALHAAATPGDWEPATLGGPGGKIIALVQREDGDWVPVAYFCDYEGEGESANPEADRSSIAANHNTMPSLLACVDALRSLYPDHPALAPLVKEKP